MGDLSEIILGIDVVSIQVNITLEWLTGDPFLNIGSGTGLVSSGIKKNITWTRVNQHLQCHMASLIVS